MSELGFGRYCPFRDDACRDECGTSPCALRGLEGMSGDGLDEDILRARRRRIDPDEIGLTTDQDGDW